MFKNRVQIGRLGGVDGLVGNAGNLEFDAQVNRKPVVMFDKMSKLDNLSHSKSTTSLTASRTTCCTTNPQLIEVVESDTKADSVRG